MRNLRERNIKRALMKQLMESGKVKVEDVVEWLWEDFGIRCRPSWKDVERKVVKSDEVTPNDLAVFMLESGLQPREEIWFEGDL